MVQNTSRGVDPFRIVSLNLALSLTFKRKSFATGKSKSVYNNIENVLLKSGTSAMWHVKYVNFIVFLVVLDSDMARRSRDPRWETQN